jgi:cellulose biosynthesis protein BcsQ
MSETDTEESVPKWPGFDVPVPNIEPTAEGKEVGVSHLDSTRLELLLEISIEGKCHFVLVDSGASLSVIKPGISNSELLPTQTAAKGITGKKLRITGTQIITFLHGK